MARFAVMSKLKPGALGAIAFFSVGLCFVNRAGIATTKPH
jgi:hypothetical protein